MRYIIAKVDLESVTPYSQSRYHDVPKIGRESPADYDERTWAERLHYNDAGYVFIPRMAFIKAIQSAASQLGMKLKGAKTYSQIFRSGIFMESDLTLPLKKDDVTHETYFVNADGKKGSGTRVKRRFPVIPEWEGSAEFHILNDVITKDVFTLHLQEAGRFTGIGRFRPENGGFYGRFSVKSVSWQVMNEEGSHDA